MAYGIIGHYAGCYASIEHQAGIPKWGHPADCNLAASASNNGTPHGYKYRLNYSLPDGSTLVRYDNERGKGDHKHIRDKQYQYKFTSIRQLLLNFNSDVLDNGGSL